MSLASNRNALGDAGSFATSRRGHTDGHRVREMKRLGIGVQNIAMQLGCSMETVRRILNPANDDKASTGEPWPFGEASDQIQTVVRYVAKEHSTTLAAVATAERMTREMQVRDAIISSVQELAGASLIQMAGIFRIDTAGVSRAIRQHRSRPQGPAK